MVKEEQLGTTWTSNDLKKTIKTEATKPCVKLTLQVQLAHGSPTGIIGDCKNITQLYQASFWLQNFAKNNHFHDWNLFLNASANFAPGSLLKGWVKSKNESGRYQNDSSACLGEREGWGRGRGRGDCLQQSNIILYYMLHVEYYLYFVMP